MKRWGSLLLRYMVCLMTMDWLPKALAEVFEAHVDASAGMPLLRHPLHVSIWNPLLSMEQESWEAFFDEHESYPARRIR